MADQEEGKKPPRVVGPITTEEHKVLIDAPVYRFDPTNPEHIKQRNRASEVLGRIGVSGLDEEPDGRADTFVLVEGVDEDGDAVPAYFAELDPKDLGTRIESHAAQEMGLPTPRDASEMLQIQPKPDVTSQ